MEKGSREKAPLPKPGTLFAPHLHHLGRKQFHSVKHQRTVSASRKAKASLYKKVQDGLAVLFFDTGELFYSNSRIQAKFNHFLRSAVRKFSFHTKRQKLYFRCSSVRCSLEYYSAAVAVPAHSRLLCLNAAFPESRGRCVFVCPQTGLKGKPPCPHSASTKTSTTPS